MSNFYFSAPNGQRFEIRTPVGTTEDQARAMFEQQVASGGLTGFRIGDALNASTQTADGLVSAKGSLLQSVAGVAGKLNPSTNLNSITSTLGINGLPAAGQLSSSLTGTIPAIASNFTTTTTTGDALLGTTGEISTGYLTQIASRGLTGQSAIPGSLANQSLSGIASAVRNLPINPIGTADLTKQAPALSGIGSMSQNDVTGTLAAANKLVNQTADQISNSLGVGKYGFDIGQLEKLGYVKPGTSNLYGINNPIIDILKSPTVWTGKDGVLGLDNILGNSTLQDNAQQELMVKGLAELDQIGIPTDSLSPEALSGLLTSAAKSVPDTVDSLVAAAGSTVDAVTNAIGNFKESSRFWTFQIIPSLKVEIPYFFAANKTSNN
jgi:hypothetical protein